MDKTLVLGYTRIGPAVRRRWWPADPAPGSLDGKHVLVTGGSSGIGKAAAARLAALGASVHLLSADAEQLEEARSELTSAVPGAQIDVELCDVASLREVSAWAPGFAGRVPSLHALVHNAGTKSPERTVTAEGNELTLATHVLGPFLLTRMLTEALEKDGDARVVWVSSGGMYASPLRSDDPQFEDDDYSGEVAYARTKRMQLVLAEQWGEELAPRGVVSHSMHPGWVDTPGVQTFLPKFRALTLPFMRTPEQGADTIVWLVAAPEAHQSTGVFWHDRRPRPTTYGRQDRETAAERRTFWDFCESRTQVDIG